jgi:hypothetical protein
MKHGSEIRSESKRMLLKRIKSKKSSKEASHASMSHQLIKTSGKELVTSETTIMIGIRIKTPVEEAGGEA